MKDDAAADLYRLEGGGRVDRFRIECEFADRTIGPVPVGENWLILAVRSLSTDVEGCAFMFEGEWIGRIGLFPGEWNACTPIRLTSGQRLKLSSGVRGPLWVRYDQYKRRV